MVPRVSKIPVTPSVRDTILAVGDHLEIIADHAAKNGRPDREYRHAIEVVRDMVRWNNLYTRGASK